MMLFLDEEVYNIKWQDTKNGVLIKSISSRVLSTYTNYITVIQRRTAYG